MERKLVLQHITDAPLRFCGNGLVVEGYDVVQYGTTIGRFIFKDRQPAMVFENAYNFVIRDNSVSLARDFSGCGMHCGIHFRGCHA